ncbi:hypothetical protein WKV44_03010 [Spirochaetia bacterium 38H-sp]|uniref:DUF3996 domain-containing protein n=1 Tax=Rarispira pelagica TaxID=3141764 RepID=A0ABU9UAM2_9SPIR
MKKKIIIALLLVLITIFSAQAQESGLGLGIILGEPTGLSLKMWIADLMAIDAAASWSFVGKGSIYIHGDYLLHIFDIIPTPKEMGTFHFQYGIGGRIQIADNPIAGIRFPFGLSYYFKRIPLEMAIELAPIIDILPATQFSANAGFIIRYYFPLSPR